MEKPKYTKKQLLAIELYPKMPTHEVVKKTKLSKFQIHNLVTSLKLVKEYNYFFTDLEDKFLIENYGKFKTTQIAKELNRDIMAVRNRVAKLQSLGKLNRIIALPKTKKTN